MDWDWSEMLKIAVSAGASTAIVQGAFKFYGDRWVERGKAAFVAVRVSLILEKYTRDCIILVSQNEQAEFNYVNGSTEDDEKDESQFEVSFDLPDLAAFPEDTDGWRSLSVRTVGKILSFRGDVDAAQQSIDSLVRYAEDAAPFVGAYASDLGVAAWLLAKELRKKYRIDPAEVPEDMDVLVQAQEKGRALRGQE